MYRFGQPGSVTIVHDPITGESYVVDGLLDGAFGAYGYYFEPIAAFRPVRANPDRDALALRRDASRLALDARSALSKLEDWREFCRANRCDSP